MMQKIYRWRSDQFQPPFYFDSGQFDTRAEDSAQYECTKGCIKSRINQLSDDSIIRMYSYQTLAVRLMQNTVK